MTFSSNDFINAVTFGASSVLLPSNPKSNFENTETSSSSTTLFIIIIVLIIIVLCSTIATYKLTNSGFQTLLCFLFGFLYMSIAYIYYGLSGRKICK